MPHANNNIDVLVYTTNCRQQTAKTGTQRETKRTRAYFVSTTHTITKATHGSPVARRTVDSRVQRRAHRARYTYLVLITNE